MLGALCFGSGALVVFRAMDDRLRDATAKADAATDRLLAAWHSGTVIPAPEQDVMPDAYVPPDPVVADWLEQWDDAGRAAYGRKAAMLARQGMSGAEIVVTLDRARTAGTEAN